MPAAFVEVAELPQTANGKLDVGALPAPRRLHRPTTVAIEAPETETERVLVRLCEQILRLEPVSIGDDFFELGGDSLAAIELSIAASEALGRPIPDEFAFTHHRLRELAAAIDAIPAAPSESSPLVEPGAGRGDDGAPRLAPAERALLFEAKLDPASPAYNVAWLYRIGARLDAGQVRLALETIVARHEPLSWTFDEPRRLLTPAEAVELRVTSDPADMATIGRRAAALQGERFDLDNGPLLRAELSEVGDGTTALALVVHHVSADAGSLDVLWSEFVRLLEGVPLDPIGFGYADHVAAQAERIADDERFWRAAWAAPAVDPLELVAVTGTDGYVARSLEVTASQLRRGPAPSAFGVVLTAIAVALRRYAPADRFTLGIAASTRDPAAQDLIGYFLNVLPVPIEVAASDSIDAIGERMGRVVADVLAHRRVPASRLIADTRLTDHPIPSPSVIVAFEDLADSSCTLFEADHEILWSGSAVVDSTIFVQVRGESVNLAVEHRGTRVGAEVAAGLIDDVAAALQYVLGDRLRTVGEITLPSIERGELNGPPLGDVGPAVLDRILSVAADRPESPAIRCGRTTTTFGELVEAASATGDQLTVAGVRRGDRVAVIADRSAASIAAMLGCWTVGAAYVPIDPTAPADRQALIAAESGAAVTWSAGSVSGRRVGSADRADENLPTDTAYVLFTSGSTGVPRGVAVTHAELAASNHARVLRYRSTPPRFLPPRFLMVSSLGFDSSVAGIYYALATGGTVVLPTDAEAIDVDALVGLLESEQVTDTLMVPTLYSAMLARAPRSSPWPAVVIVAGEACPPELVRRHHAAHPEAELHNEYGPTEATVWSTAHRCSPGDTRVPIGTPIHGTTVRVVDPDGNPVPLGCRGELEITGPGVTAGYVNDTGATLERFITRADGTRSYRSGDRGHVADDVVWFAGRLDDQLSVGGLRIEPREIEAVLERRPDIASAVVALADPRPMALALAELDVDTQRRILAGAAASDRPLAALGRELAVSSGRAVLVGHLEPVSGESVDLTAARQALAALPPKMRPARLMVWDALPRTAHGKLDRAALVGVLPTESSEAPNPIAPGTAASDAAVHLVVDVFADALGRPVGPDEDFFLAGGDSLGALGAVIELERRTGRTVAITELIDASTARRLAASFGDLGAEGSAEFTHPLVEWFEPIPQDDPDAAVLLMFAYGGGGHLLGYRHLVAELRLARPGRGIIGFRLPGADARTEPRSTIEGQIESFWEPLREIVGNRPCVLFGGSSGGLLAWEAAHRLAAEGRHDRVVLMDTVHPAELRESRRSRLGKYLQLVTTEGVLGAAREVATRVAGRMAFRKARRKFMEAPAGLDGAAIERELVVRRSVDDAALGVLPGSAGSRRAVRRREPDRPPDHRRSLGAARRTDDGHHRRRDARGGGLDRQSAGRGFGGPCRSRRLAGGLTARARFLCRCCASRSIRWQARAPCVRRSPNSSPPAGSCSPTAPPGRTTSRWDSPRASRLSSGRSTIPNACKTCTESSSKRGRTSCSPTPSAATGTG